MSYPLFLTVTTVTVTSSLFSLFPYEASKCPEQFVGQIRGGLWSFSEDRRHDDVCSLILSNPYHSALKVIKVPRSIFGRIMITALELASLCKAKNRPPITRFLFFLPWKVISGTVPRFSVPRFSLLQFLNYCERDARQYWKLANAGTKYLGGFPFR